MSRGLIVPVHRREAMRIIEDLEAGSTASYSAALGGVELCELQVVSTWSRHLNLFCGGGVVWMKPRNPRAQWLSSQGRVHGPALFTGVEGRDLPLEFLSYLDDNGFMGSTLEI